MIDLSNEVTTFVITTSKSANYNDCIKALQDQTVKTKIEIIKDYHPMPAAFQQMIENCTTPYYVQVDDDMILYPNSIEIMYNEIKKTVDNVCMIAFRLKDIHLDFIIYGVKIYKHSIFKKYPYNLSCLSCEIEQTDRIKKDGYVYLTLEPVLGDHSPKWFNGGIFERYFNLMEKFKEYGYTWLEMVPMKLWNKIKVDPSDQNIYALLGAYTSLIKKEVEHKEKDFLQNKQLEFSIMESCINFPTNATVYMTSNCNFKCEWCYRQHQEIESFVDFDVYKVKELMNRFPSIKGVCICGYGEPLLSPNLPKVIEALKSYNVYVGLITNGSLLKQKLPMLLDTKYRPNYISISLNAGSPEQHQKITKTNTFFDVLEGIKFCIMSGMETYVTYVCTKENIQAVPNFLRVVKNLGVKNVYLHNVLPHFNDKENNMFWNLVLQKNDEYLINEIKNLPDADIVKIYPVLIDKNELRRYCKWPWISIAVNGNGSISICNSVLPCNKNYGNIRDSKLWRSDYANNLRKEILEGTNNVCNKCFRNWMID